MIRVLELRVYGLQFTVYSWDYHNWKLETKNWKLIFALLLIPCYLSSQTPAYKLVKTIPTTATILSSDKLGNCYVVNGKQELLKISPEGEMLSAYTNKSLGQISFVGTTNPLKILVYYVDYSTIITLDNTLSQTGRINLLELGSNKASAACVGLDNNIWIYDEVLYKLRKLDDRLNVLAETEDLNVLFSLPVRANFLLEKDNYLYLNDTSKGILVFDTYGTYYKTIPLKGLTDFQKVQEWLVYFQHGKLFSYHLLTFTTEEVNLPGSDAINAVVEKDRLFILRKEQLDVYSY